MEPTEKYLLDDRAPRHQLIYITEEADIHGPKNSGFKAHCNCGWVSEGAKVRTAAQGKFEVHLQMEQEAPHYTPGDIRRGLERRLLGKGGTLDGMVEQEMFQPEIQRFVEEVFGR